MRALLMRRPSSVKCCTTCETINNCPFVNAWSCVLCFRGKCMAGEYQESYNSCNSHKSDSRACWPSRWSRACSWNLQHYQYALRVDEPATRGSNCPANNLLRQPHNARIASPFRAIRSGPKGKVRHAVSLTSTAVNSFY
jgi:hypothetical protein